ncbi:MAG: flagellar basal body P-ring formation protein FlgA [Planctomycetes bacterium]|nr:flagellar basal body P-ring formation protein FlgA [Planctomycetota bacterium]
MSSSSLKYLVLLVVLALGLSSSYVLGADVVLRERATTSGPIVRLGDVADITAASTSTLKNLASTPLVPTPAPGSTEFLQRSQIRDLLATRGIDMLRLRIRGAAVVEIGKATKQPEIETPTAPSNREIETALHDAIEQYLQNETGHDLWRITVSPTSKALGPNFTVRGGRKPWTGRQRFRVSGTHPDEAFEVQATVVKIQSVLFSRQVIKKGDIIRAADVERRQHEGRVPGLVLSTLDQVVGMEARRTIRADVILQENQVRAPLQVERGETVTVVARTGGISVRTFAVARQDGAMGDLVQIETLDGSQRFAARVSGRHRLEVLAAGTQAGDYATLGRLPLRR